MTTILWDERLLGTPVAKNSNITLQLNSLVSGEFSLNFNIEVGGVQKTFLRQVITVAAINPNNLVVQAVQLEFPFSASTNPANDQAINSIQELRTLFKFPVSDFLAT